MKEQILELREQGLSYNQIVERLGCSKGTIAYHCGTGQKDKAVRRERDRRNKAIKLLQEYKQSRGCMDCGENYPYWMLEFDHVRGEKLANLSGMISRFPLEKVLEEIEKCEVVCANCHRIRTWQRKTTSGDSTMSLEDIY